MSSPNENREPIQIHQAWKMPEDSWYPFEDSATLGLAGSEGGSILRDDEHPAGARITLEKETTVAPFAITCGIYGYMVHTRFFGLESEATSQYDEMKNALSAILEQTCGSDDKNGPTFNEKVIAFIETYP